MLNIIYTDLKRKSNIIMLVSIFTLFMGIYYYLDLRSVSNYTSSNANLYVINIIVNIIISLLSSFSFVVGNIYTKITKEEAKGSLTHIFAIIFGLVTYSCPSCIATYWSLIGITIFSTTLPLGGFYFKLISLLLVAIGFIFINLSIYKTNCNIKIS